MLVIINIHKYLRQFCYSYWWRAHHVGVYKLLFVTSKKCWNMGMTRELAPTLIRQFLHSFWSRATAETVVPHHIAQHSLIRSCLPEGGGGPYHFHSWRGVVLKEIIEQLYFLHFFYFLTKSVDVVWPKEYLWLGIKVCWIALQLVFTEAWFLIIYLHFVLLKLSRTRPRWD